MKKLILALALVLIVGQVKAVGSHRVKGHMRNGKWVSSYRRTNPNHTITDNYGYRGRFYGGYYGGGYYGRSSVTLNCTPTPKPKIDPVEARYRREKWNEKCREAGKRERARAKVREAKRQAENKLKRIAYEKKKAAEKQKIEAEKKRIADIANAIKAKEAERKRVAAVKEKEITDVMEVNNYTRSKARMLIKYRKKYSPVAKHPNSV
jgi:hypothetical protein